jgi:hypothetical protein
MWLPAIVCVSWAVWAWPQVDPDSFDWMTGDVEMTAAVALVMSLLAAATGVVAGRMLRSTAVP